jgi:hypothetical protein
MKLILLLNHKTKPVSDLDGQTAPHRPWFRFISNVTLAIFALWLLLEVCC